MLARIWSNWNTLCLWECKLLKPLWKIVWLFFVTLNNPIKNGQKPWTDFTKEDIRVAGRHIRQAYRKARPHLRTGKHKLKSQLESISHPLHGLKEKRWTPPNVFKDVEQLECTFLMGV